MINIKENYSLKNLNTFGLDVSAKYYTSITSEAELLEILNSDQFKNINKFILGEGSNILFFSDYNGLVVHNRIKGIEEKLSDDSVYLKIGAGENWDELVQFAVSKGYGGIENLSLIPGSVGAAPIQNIGAYGVELESVFYSLEGFFIENLKKKTFTKDECNFGYRNSIFKNELKSKFIITSVTLKLKRRAEFNLTYSALKSSFEKSPGELTLKDIRNKVIEIRESKLPDPNELHNAGSFFKNPYINKRQLQKLLGENPDMIYYPVEGDNYKIAAGWLIEKSGMKGVRDGNVGTYPKQALVIVNYGAKSGEEILNFAKLIQSKVLENFGILLEPEVNIINQ